MMSEDPNGILWLVELAKETNDNLELRKEEIIGLIDSSWSPSPCAEKVITTNMRLPRFDLNSFDGDPMQWITFWSIFDAAFHQQRTEIELPIIILKGKAAAVVQKDCVSSENYDDELLKQRFGDVFVILKSLYSKLAKRWQ